MDSHATLYLKIADSMTGLIRCGTLTRGQRIPSIRVTAKQFGVSLSTAVQAYRTLEDARLIEARPRSGYFVTAQSTSLPEPASSRPPIHAQLVGVSALASRVIELAHTPGYISFGTACPAPELFDQERVRRAIHRAALKHRHTLCQYPLGPGELALRQAIARHAIRMGCQLDAQSIVITHSCLEALTLCLRSVTRAGDTVALESPIYFGLLEILESLSLRALEIPTHPRTGLSLDALQLALDTQPIKAIIAIPTLSNPLGSCMPVHERRRLAQMIKRYQIPLIEDVVYSDLAEDDEKRRAIKSFDTEGLVMICGSFSKTITPSLRLGWIEAGRWHAKVQRLKAATSGSPPQFLEYAMADLLTQPGIEAGYRQLRQTFANQMQEARHLIAHSFPKGTRVTNPAGGFILWVELPTGLDSLALFQACQRENICIAPGVMFSASDRFKHCIRLGVGGRWQDPERAAIVKIGQLASELLAHTVKVAN